MNKVGNFYCFPGNIWNYLKERGPPEGRRHMEEGSGRADLQSPTWSFSPWPQGVCCSLQIFPSSGENKQSWKNSG